MWDWLKSPYWSFVGVTLALVLAVPMLPIHRQPRVTTVYTVDEIPELAGVMIGDHTLDPATEIVYRVLAQIRTFGSEPDLRGANPLEVAISGILVGTPTLVRKNTKIPLTVATDSGRGVSRITMPVDVRSGSRHPLMLSMVCRQSQNVPPILTTRFGDIRSDSVRAEKIIIQPAIATLGATKFVMWAWVVVSPFALVFAIIAVRIPTYV